MGKYSTDFNLKVFEATGESGNSLGYFSFGGILFFMEIMEMKYLIFKRASNFLKAANLNHVPNIWLRMLRKWKRRAKNVKAAEKWYLEAANENNPNSAFRLGLMYSNGVLGKINKIEAAKWNFASQGHVFAMFNYGLSCLLIMIMIY